MYISHPVMHIVPDKALSLSLSLSIYLYMRIGGSKEPGFVADTYKHHSISFVYTYIFMHISIYTRA